MTATPPIVSSAGYLLYKTGVHAQQAFEAAFAAVGLNAREFLLLAFAAGEPLSQQDVARRLGIDPTIVVGIVDELERRDLVHRVRDRADRRRYLLTVTPGGHDLLAKATETAEDATRDYLQPLSATQQRQLGKLLLTLMTPKLPWLSD